jgi:Tfp pilus assembly protein PilO
VSEQPKNDKRFAAGQKRMGVRLRQFRDSRKFAMLGVPEMVGLAISALLIVVVVVSYFYFLTPARARLKSIEKENELLRNRIVTAQQGVDLSASPQASVDEINQSLERFERESLFGSRDGRLDLYAKLNDMIQRNKLRNTAGPVYAALESLGGPGAPASAARAGNARWQTLYPGISISVTVEGAYSNLRHFLNEVETSRHFIVINAVELEGVSDANSQSGATQVSLRLDMATYFQRAGATLDAMPGSETR